MKPHRRKDNPPRRESGEGGQAGEEYPEAGDPQEFDPAAYAEQVPYDPGAALAEENETYGASESVDYDPNQAAYADPNQAYYESGQGGYVDPGETAYYDPNQGAYVDPNQAAYYAPNEAGYADPGQEAYYEPNQGYPVPSGSGVYDEAPAPPPVSPPPAAPAPKKKVTHRAPQRRPAAGKRPPSSRRPGPKPVTYGGGVSFMTVFLSLVAVAMLAVVVMVMLPRDMSAVGAYPVNPLSGEKPRNLLAEVQKEMIDRKSELSFTEAEVNQYLNHRLAGEQKGAMAALVKFRGIYLDFEKDSADVIIEREFFGMPITMSAKLVAEPVRGRASYKSAGWTLGRVELGSRNVKPVIEMFLRLRGACVDEYQAIQQMSDVRFEDDRLVLDARI
ncbi:MAG: hypothetical protein KDN18_23025 [Verrucomicrobiae bacterium]|nr:hypothetical protein [Verrucomicrobiae bacterium]